MGPKLYHSLSPALTWPNTRQGQCFASSLSLGYGLQWHLCRGHFMKLGHRSSVQTMFYCDAKPSADQGLVTGVVGPGPGSFGLGWQGSPSGSPVPPFSVAHPIQPVTLRKVSFGSSSTPPSQIACSQPSPPCSKRTGHLERSQENTRRKGSKPEMEARAMTAKREALREGGWGCQETVRRMEPGGRA